MISPKIPQKEHNVGGQVFEEFLKFVEEKYNLSKDEFLTILEEKSNKNNSFPISILASKKLSSLEAIVKFLREERKLSYDIIGQHVKRKPKTLAVTYSVARRKMPELFSKDIDTDTIRIPFTAFSLKLSILECICNYMKSSGKSYAEISRLLNKDQRTIWTVCKRAEKKIAREGKSDNRLDKSNGKDYGR